MALSTSHMQMQLYNLVNAVRSSRLYPASTSAGNKEVQPKQHQETTKQQASTVTANQQKTCGIMVQTNAVELLDPITFTPKPDVNHWKVSHKSADTFYENRHGVRSPLPLLTHPLISSLCQSVLGYSPSHHFVHNVMVKQIRGFKTKRSNSTGLAGASSTKNRAALGRIQTVKMPEHSIPPNIDWMLQRMMDSSRHDGRDIDSEIHRENLVKLLQDAKLTPEEEAKLKIAFAEGYHADWAQYIKNYIDRSGGNIDKLAFAEGYRKAAKRSAPNKVTLISSIVKIVSSLMVSGVAIGVCWLIYSSMSGGGRRVNILTGDQFEVNPEKVMVTFDDVRGSDEAKKELMNVVDFLKNPGKYTELGAKLPNGCLLVGPPGVGKTLLARAVAGEAGVPFFQASGAEFDEVFVGTGAKKVRQLFSAAKARTPCVIFIDEIDSVGGKRTSSEMHPYANQTINQLLTEMDGFQTNEGIIVLGATNKKENLDKALLRPGRFDVQVSIRVPDLRERESILQLYLPKIKCGSDVDIKSISRSTTGCTGADLENITNHAAMKAAQDGKAVVSMGDIEYAIDKVRMGPQKSRIPLPAVNKLTAWHEAGHALVKFYQKSSSSTLHKITILPRGDSLGMTHMLGEERSEYQKTKEDMLADMDVCFGGRIAEEMLNGPDGVSTGASADMMSASQTATAMVTQLGFSDKLGMRFYPETHELSPKVQEEIDEEIKILLKESHERARKLLHAHKKELAILADALLEYEELTFEEAKTIIEGGKLQREVRFSLNRNKAIIAEPVKTVNQM